MFKNLLVLFTCSLLLKSISAQYDTFHIGMGVFDFDNVSNVSSVPKGTDPVIGNDTAYLKMLKDNGFDMILPYHQLLKNPVKYASTKPSKGFLDRADALGMKVILHCPETIYGEYDNSTKDLDANLDNALNYYASHPAVIGFSIGDEPNITDYPVIKSISTKIKQYNPQLLRFVNLFPTYATSKQLDPNNIGGTNFTKDYNNYITSLIPTTDVNFLSVDNYVTFAKSPFFYNLEVLSENAQKHNVPYFCMISVREKSRKLKSESLEQFKYSIFANLLYGAKGLYYYSREGGYCCNHNCNDCSTIASNNWDKNVNEHTKEELSKIHKSLLNNADLLFELKLNNVYHYSNISGLHSDYYESISPKSQWNNLKNDAQFQKYFKKISKKNCSDCNYLAVSFLNDKQGNDYMWLFNKNINDNLQLNLKFKTPTTIENILEGYSKNSIKKITEVLPAGSGKLIRLSNL